jgi:CelD/BcsL family acetyltransferase involved in cellulose biosynthesis
LERDGEAVGSRPVHTPFQAGSWITAYGQAFRTQPIDIVVEAEGKRIVLPLAIRRLGPFRVADVVGAKHASFHAPIIDAGFETATDRLLAALRREARAHGIDALLITDCPETIDGRANPLAVLAHQPSPSFARELAIAGSGEAVLHALLDRDDRKKLRQKETKLAQEFGPARATFATTEEERHAALQALRHWKSIRFGEKGIDDPFACPEAQNFLNLATHGDAPAVRLFTLHFGARLVAVMAGAASATRFSGMANAHDPEPAVMKSSPGDLLIRHLVATLADRGYRQFDLGVGEARYKNRWCPDILSLFDCAIAATAGGAMAANGFLVQRRVKRWIKQSETGMRIVESLRALKARAFNR